MQLNSKCMPAVEVDSRQTSCYDADSVKHLEKAMTSEKYESDNVKGLMVQYVDMGVEYEYAGKKLRIIGEQDNGEVSVEDKVIGYYETDEDNTVTITLRDERKFTLDGDSEEDFEKFALQMLK